MYIDFIFGFSLATICVTIIVVGLRVLGENKRR